MKRMSTIVFLFAIVFALAAGGVYYMKRQGAYVALSDTPSPSTSPSVKTDENTRQITVTAKEFAFEPPKLTISKGEKISLTLKNMGSTAHTLAIEGTSAITPVVQPGEEATITFSMDTAGKYTFLCTVPGHKDAGMQGDLIISE